MSAKFKILDRGDGTGQVVDAKGRPLELESESGDGTEPVIVQCGSGWFQRTPSPTPTAPPTPPAPPKSEAAPTTPKSGGPLTEAEFKAALASTSEGLAVLSDAGRYAAHLAACRAAGDVA